MKPQWKIEREREIKWHIVLALAMLLAWVFGFSIGLIIDNLKPSEIKVILPQEEDEKNVAEVESAEGIEESESEQLVSIVEEETEEHEAMLYSNEDLELLAHLLYAEQGADWVSDETIYFTGSVVLNRINDSRYPDNLHDVIYQKCQYAVTGWMWDREPSDRCYEIAEDLLINGSVLPANVLGQAEFEQMDGVYCYQDNTYFCYWN